MQSLGAVDAVNLDGGGSTTMTVEPTSAVHLTLPSAPLPTPIIIQPLALMLFRELSSPDLFSSEFSGMFVEADSPSLLSLIMENHPRLVRRHCWLLLLTVPISNTP